MATTFEGVRVEGLPPEVEGLGRPDAVFAARSLARTPIGAILLVCGVLMLFCACAAIYAYFNVPFPKDGPPAEIVLGVGAFAAVFGFVMLAVALNSPSGKGDPNAFQGYLVYPTALIRAKDGSCTVFPWDQVEALVNPDKPISDFQVLAADGRKIPVDRAIEGYMDLLGTILQCVKAGRLGPARNQLAAGQTVVFGPFGVSLAGLELKGKRLPWDQVTTIGIVIQNGHRRLRIKRHGALWPWCYTLLYGLPNEAIFFELLEEARSAQPAIWR